MGHGWNWSRMVSNVETSISASKALFIVCYFVGKALQPDPA
jgi:hypothetical protein